jgi:hypothetical protein
MYDPKRRARHPVAVAELNDAALLSRIADQLDGSMDQSATVPARQALIHAITILRGASNSLRP